MTNDTCNFRYKEGLEVPMLERSVRLVKVRIYYSKVCLLRRTIGLASLHTFKGHWPSNKLLLLSS